MYKSTLIIVLLVILQKSTQGYVTNTVNGNPVNGTTISAELTSSSSQGQQCPEGYNYCPISNQCTPQQTYSSDCPSGYRHDLQTHRCIRIGGVVNQKSCPFGYSFIGGSCVLSCPFGYVLDGLRNTCHRSRITHSSNCPAGEGWNGQRCLPKTVALSCPDGYKMENGKCTKTHYGSMVCPENHIINPNDPTQCTSKQTFIPDCPAGFLFINNQCQKSTQNAKTCPPGYLIQNGACTRTEIVQKLNCPENFYLENNLCVSKSAATEECPFGTSKIGDTCVKRSQGVFKCEFGYILHNNECVKYEKSVLHCSAPYKLVNGQCVISVSMQ